MATKKIPLIESLQDARIELLLTESLGGTVRVKHKVLLLDVETGNGRTYPKLVVEAAVKEARQSMDGCELLCTFSGHPPEVFPEPNMASHYVIDSWIEGDYLWAESVVMGDTAEGAKLLGAIKNGAAIGVSVRGVGAVTGNRVTEYTYYGFDYVGTPSTGLRVKPTVVEDNSIRESAEVTATSYIRENSLVANSGVLNNKGKRMSNQVTFADFQQTLNECIELVSASKGKHDIGARITMAEARINKSLSEIDNNTAPFGQLSISEALGKWHAVKEASVINTSAEDKATSFEPSVGGSPEPAENKNTVSAKASAKEAADKVADATDAVQRLQDELNESRKANQALQRAAKAAQSIALRESSKIQGINALYKSKVRALNEARSILGDAKQQITESMAALKAERAKSEKLAEGLMKVRKESVALAKSGAVKAAGVRKPVVESRNKVAVGARRKIAEASGKQWAAVEMLMELIGTENLLDAIVKSLSDKEANEILSYIGRNYIDDIETSDEFFDVLGVSNVNESMGSARGKVAESRKAPASSADRRLVQENLRLKKRVAKLAEEYEEMAKIADDLEARIDNQSPLEDEATKVAVALELALEESVTENYKLKQRLAEALAKAGK